MLSNNMSVDELKKNFDIINKNIMDNCRDKSKPPKLIAVTKTVNVDVMNILPNFGQLDVGENKAQVITAKLPEIDKKLNIHFIGRLQTNKIRYIISDVCLIHSLDRPKLAKAISEQAQSKEIVMPVLVQVNIAGETQKAGFAPDDIHNFLKNIKQYPGISVKGLMAIMPNINDEIQLSKYFANMRTMFDQIREEALPNVSMETLSMGMSQDYIIAVREGATAVRVGSALFKS